MIYPPPTQDYPHLYIQIFSMVESLKALELAKATTL